MYLFVAGFVLYCLSSYVSYDESIKNGPWYYYYGIGLSIFANLCWFKIAKISQSNKDILLNGAIWDSMILFCFIIVPFFLFTIDLGPKEYLGLGLILSGISIIKFI